jgi:hypothetical protein
MAPHSGLRNSCGMTKLRPLRWTAQEIPIRLTVVAGRALLLVVSQGWFFNPQAQ